MLIFLLTEEYLLSLSEAPGDANTYDTLTLPHDRNLVRGHRTGSTKSGVEEHLREKKKKTGDQNKHYCTTYPGAGWNSTRGRDSKLKKLRTKGCRHVVQASPQGTRASWRLLLEDDARAFGEDDRLDDREDMAVNGLRSGLLAPQRKQAANSSGLSRTGFAWSTQTDETNVPRKRAPGQRGWTKKKRTPKENGGI